MANVYVTQNGTGDGSLPWTPIAIGSLSATEWNTPAHSADGAERIYFTGVITTQVLPLGAGGTSDTLRLWIDLTNASIAVVGANIALYISSLSYLKVVGGVWTSTVDNTFTMMYIQNCENSITITDATITTHKIGISVVCGSVDCTDLIIENNTITTTQTTTANAITLAHSSVAGETGKYVNGKINGNTLNGGKIDTAYSDMSQQILIDGRRDVGWDIDNNTISNTPGNAIQIMFVEQGYVRNNILTNIGIVKTTVNAIQINNALGLIIENNTVNGNLNGGGIGDGSGIMVDWCGENCSGGGIGAYSEDCIVRYNNISGCNSWDKAGGISIWAGIRTQVYGNICTNNSAGISVSDAVSAKAFTYVSATDANPCVITFSTTNTFEIFTDDYVVISGNVTLNGTHTATRLSATTFSIPVDTTGGAGSGTTIEGVNRGINNVVYKNTCDNNTKAGFLTKYGAQDVTLHSNILSNSQYGCIHDPQYRSVLATETYNDYHNNSVNNILDDATPTAVDTTSLEVNPLFIPDSYQLSASSTLIGAGLAGVDIGAIDYVAREYGGGGGGSITYNLLTAQLFRGSSAGSSTPSVPPAELQPVITLQPEIGLTVTAPTAFVLTVEATNAQSYQWRYASGDGAVPNGTSSTLTVDPSIEGTWGYYCVVTNVTLTAQTIDVFVTVSAASAWQLEAGHYVSATTTSMPLNIVYPMNGVDSTAVASYKFAYPAQRYEKNISVQGGAFPFKFEVTTGPVGMVIGETLTASGSKQIMGDDYGVVSWPTPTTGTHTVLITVTDQDGNTDTVTWDLEVDATNFVFVAPAGDDAAAGTFAAPLQTFTSGIYINDTDNSWLGKQVIFRAGTYDIHNGASGTDATIDATYKPMGYDAYHDGANYEAVTFNHVTGHITTPSDDFSLCHIQSDGVKTGATNPRTITLSNPAQAGANIFKTSYANMIGGSSNNSNVCYLFAAGTGATDSRDGVTMSRVTTETTSNCSVAILFDCTNVVVENCIADDITWTFPVGGSSGAQFLNIKDECNDVSVRYNSVRDGSGASGTLLIGAQDVDNSNIEVCYNTITGSTNLGVDGMIMWNQQTSGSAVNEHDYRNTTYNTNGYSYRFYTNTTTTIVQVQGDAGYGSNGFANGVSYSSADKLFSSTSFDVNYFLIGAGLTDLGTYGAEIA